MSASPHEAAEERTLRDVAHVSATQQTGAYSIDSSSMNVLSHCGARCDPRWEVALRTWPFSSAGTLAAIAIVAETGDATLGDHLYLHRVRSLETPRNAHSSCRLT